MPKALTKKERRRSSATELWREDLPPRPGFVPGKCQRLDPAGHKPGPKEPLLRAGANHPRDTYHRATCHVRLKQIENLRTPLLLAQNVF